MSKLEVTAEHASAAALNLVFSLMTHLAKAGKLNNEEILFIAASAASMCETNADPKAAELIRQVIPQSRDVNVVEAAKRLGYNVEQVGT